MIKDSGERTAFSTGAVRDMHAGKGRCDLLPMCVLLRLARHYEAGALKYDERNCKCAELSAGEQPVLFALGSLSLQSEHDG